MHHTLVTRSRLAFFFGAALLAACDSTPTDDDGGGGSTSSTTTTTTAASTTASSTTTGATTGSSSSSGTGGAPDTWQVPTCTPIHGTNAVTFTKDEGLTLTATEGVLHGVGYTGLAALDTPNTLLAEHKGDLLRSTDAGCNWSKIGDLQGGLFRITAAKGGRAYAWVDNGNALYRIDDGVPTLLTNPAQNVVGLGVDPENGLHLRMGDASGAVRDSIDGGVTWTKQGLPAPTGGLSIGYRFAFDPSNLDHVLFGQSTDGAEVTFDGGATWQKSNGLGANSNAFSLAVSPADANIVWAEAIEIGPDLRHVYRSVDGGLNFTVVATDSAEVILINGNLLQPHPTNPDVLYFVYGSQFQNYGTDLFKYDHATGMVTKTHNGNDDVSSIAHSPADPTVMYLGLVVEEIN